MLIREISPRTPEKIFLDNTNKKNDQLETNQPLTLIAANKEQKPTEKEAILFQKVKYLDEQLRKTTIERDNLKQLVHQEKQRADNYQQQLKDVAKVFKQ
jgi:hypothetical protein